MFEKVTCRRAERSALLQLPGVSAAMAAHAVCALGLATVSMAAPPAEESLEEATYLLLQTPVPLAPPSAHAAPRDHVAVPTRAAAQPRRRQRTPEPADAAREVERLSLEQRWTERALAEPRPTVDEIPPPGPALDAALLRGLGEVGDGTPGAVAGGRIASEDDGGGAPVVDVEVLANPPRMLNRHVIALFMSDDYPTGLLDRRVQGEVVVAFIVGVNGRAEMDHVQVISASHQAFVAAALRGLQRMRFRPAELDGRRVRVRVSIPFVWQLPDR
jgi:TonB family protein